MVCRCCGSSDPVQRLPDRLRVYPWSVSSFPRCRPSSALHLLPLSILPRGVLFCALSAFLRSGGDFPIIKECRHFWRLFVWVILFFDLLPVAGPAAIPGDRPADIVAYSIPSQAGPAL